MNGLASDDPKWATFLTATLRLPLWMAPAVQRAIRETRWMGHPNPVGYIKTATCRMANRMGLAHDDFKGPVDRSRRCPCGAMFQRKAIESGHTCLAGEITAFEVKLPDLSESEDRVGTRYDASDFWESNGCNLFASDDDDDNFFAFEDESGVEYRGHGLLNRVPEDLIKLTPPRDGSLYGDALIDWLAVAKRLHLDEIAATVMKLRFLFGAKRADLAVYAKIDGKPRAKYETAWKTITKNEGEIYSILRGNLAQSGQHR